MTRESANSSAVPPGLELSVQRYLGVGSLSGLIQSSRLLVQRFSLLARFRTQGGQQHQEELGAAIAAVIMASYTAEVALKQIHLIATDQKPERTHNLALLVENLPNETRRQLYEQWETVRSPLADALGNLWDGTLDRLLATCPRGFEEWRYLYETRPQNGLPGLLLRLAETAVAVAGQLYSDHPEHARIQRNRRMR